jgi:hypothetical protein
MLRYCADFETITNPDDCRVWAYAIAEVGNINNFHYGNSLDDFMEFIEKNQAIYYFHNLKFDGEFIIHWLLNHGFKHSKKPQENEFSTLISRMGQFYSIEIVYKRRKKGVSKVVIYDSLKKLPFSVANIAKSFHLEMSKLEIDYNEYREIGHELTQQEIEYIHNDVCIVAQALAVQLDQGLTKMTNGADALNYFKELIGKKKYRQLFPVLDLEMDSSIRLAYRGGWTYCNPRVADKDLGEGLVYDMNSMYPSMMVHRMLPYGRPEYFSGQYEDDELYPLYIQKIECRFKIKPNHLPTIQLKKNLMFAMNEYIEDSKEVVQMVLTNVDLKLFLEHYDIIGGIEYIDGYKFKACQGVFDQYIDYWMNIKMTSEGAIKQLAKLMLNSLYGKFATRPDVTGKIPYLENGIVRYELGEPETREPEYTPLGVFITAWARDKIIRTAQSVYDRFCYADTDSIHIRGTDIPDIEVDDKKLNYWKLESHFTRARFIRQKTYIEEIDGKLNVKCAGMPDSLKELVTWENFHVGFEKADGRLMPKHVQGGIVLVESPYKLR